MSIRDVETKLADAQDELENVIWCKGEFTPNLSRILNELHDVRMFALEIDIKDRRRVI